MAVSEPEGGVSLRAFVPMRDVCSNVRRVTYKLGSVDADGPRKRIWSPNLLKLWLAKILRFHLRTCH